MNDFIRKQDILRTWQNVCIGIICSECQFYNDDVMNGDCLLERWVHSLPSAESETKLIAEVKMSKEDIQSAVDEAVERIMAQPERKKGKWIYGEKSGQDGWYCSECGGFIPWYYDFYGLDNIDFIEDFKTCPFCDSKMVSYTGANMKEGDIK